MKIATRRVFRRFAAEERGAVTVEASLWIAFLAGVMGLMVDLSLVLMNQADMWNIASNTSRQIAIGALTPADAPTFANQQSVRGSGYTVNVSQTGDLVTTAVSIPLNDVSITSWFVDPNAQMSLTVSQRVEPTT